MTDDLRYVLFKTKAGYFGLLGSKKGLLWTLLPGYDVKTAKAYLTVGMSGCCLDKKLYLTLQKEIISYFEGIYVDFSLSVPFVLNNLSTFSQTILTVCRGIPYGKTISYSQLADLAGSGRAARAVGNALAANPMPLLIPCHRVIKSTGQTGEFSATGGTVFKDYMLQLEKNALKSKS